MKKLILGMILTSAVMATTTLVAQVLEVDSVTATTLHSLLNKETSVAIYFLPLSSNPDEPFMIVPSFLRHIGAQSVTQSGNLYTLTIAGDSRNVLCQSIVFGPQPPLTINLVCYADEAVGAQAVAELQQTAQSKCKNLI